MKSWIVRLGKSISVIKNEGFFRGGKRVFKSFISLFAPVGSGDILFVTGGVGDSARYRCHHVSEELRFHGFRVSVTVADNPFLPKYADRFSVFVFHRTPWLLSVQKLLEAIKEKEKTALFETDDLVFDKNLFEKTSAFQAMNVFEKKQYEESIGVKFITDPFVEFATVSTLFLAEKLRELNKKVFIVPNRLNEEDVRIAKENWELRMKKREPGNSQTNVVIGYFSGSTGHDRDFATIANVLKKLLDTHSNLRLLIGGPLSLPKVLEPYMDRIGRISYVPRTEHFRNLAGIDINIAPLEIGNPFCESKSELKFFEAGVVGVPTVATATGVFRDAIHDGIDGFVASNDEEWQKKLDSLITNVGMRKKMGENARETTLQNYTTKNANNEEYYNFLRKRI